MSLLVKSDFNYLFTTKMLKKIRPSCIFLLKMTAHYEKLLEKYNKFGQKLKLTSRKYLIVNQYIINNI